MINPYAFEDIARHIQRVDEIIAYEKENPMNLESLVSENKLLPKEEREKNKEEAFWSLEKFKQYLIDNKEATRQKRTENGLLNK